MLLLPILPTKASGAVAGLSTGGSGGLANDSINGRDVTSSFLLLVLVVLPLLLVAMQMVTVLDTTGRPFFIWLLLRPSFWGWRENVGVPTLPLFEKRCQTVAWVCKQRVCLFHVVSTCMPLYAFQMD